MGDMYEKLRAKIAMMKNEIYRTKREGEGRGGARQDTPLGQLAGGGVAHLTRLLNL